MIGRPAGFGRESLHRIGEASFPPARPARRSMVPSARVSYEEYLLAVALTLARRHRPVWCWRRWRRVCRCGADLPCHARHRIPINRGHWPGEDEQ
ncbi:hypothetical protein ACGFI9_10805 [Micromonospora sp. NPDC048930]|uniref:hypothetical protein n=1 Tax=Micromonospora sp. NPDC048930 TaxID=3364261 RepID=UPI003718652F